MSGGSDEERTGDCASSQLDTLYRMVSSRDDEAERASDSAASGAVRQQSFAHANLVLFGRMLLDDLSQP